MFPSIAKRRRNSRSLRSIILLAQFLILCVTLSFGGVFSVVANSDDMDAHVTQAINKHYNNAVEPVTPFKPFYLAGDFNADGARDIFAVVQLKVARGQLPKDVKVINPFGSRDITNPNQSSTSDAEGVALGFVIMHGGKGVGLSGALPNKYLLLGVAPILILDYERLQSNETKDLMSVVPLSRTRRRKYNYFRLPQTARGDWVLVNTQVAEGFIYWDGKTYRFQDSPDD